MLYNVNQTSNLIFKRSFHILNQDIESRDYAIIFLLGPSCVGKTRIRNHFFKLIKNYKPICIKAGYWMLPREERLKQNFGENQQEAYYFEKLNKDLQDFFNYGETTVHKYLHKSGRPSKTKKKIKISKIIQFEGTIWVEFLMNVYPSIVVRIEPFDYINWEIESINRNKNERGYSLDDAVKLYNLSKQSWLNFKNQVCNFNNIISLEAIHNTKTHIVEYKFKN